MTTREKGTGLGLAIVKKIVEDHGGRLELHDAPSGFHGGKGAMIRIILPRAAEGSAGTSEGGAAHNEPEQIENGI
jgi:two-component system nitrogen regulation sensor histidine kinase NtrY